MKPSGQMLTLTETAEILGVSKTTCYAWARDGRLPVVRRGIRGVRVPRPALDAYIEQQSEQALAAVKG